MRYVFFANKVIEGVKTKGYVCNIGFDFVEIRIEAQCSISLFKFSKKPLKTIVNIVRHDN